jgi:hypothetical protein
VIVAGGDRPRFRSWLKDACFLARHSSIWRNSGHGVATNVSVLEWP